MSRVSHEIRFCNPAPWFCVAQLPPLKLLQSYINIRRCLHLQQAQRLAPLLQLLRAQTGAGLHLVLNPQSELSDLPLKSYYRAALPELDNGARPFTMQNCETWILAVLLLTQRVGALIAPVQAVGLAFYPAFGPFCIAVVLETPDVQPSFHRLPEASCMQF